VFALVHDELGAVEHAIEQAKALVDADIDAHPTSKKRCQQEQGAAKGGKGKSKGKGGGGGDDECERERAAESKFARLG
jgi:hypothetical protein